MCGCVVILLGALFPRFTLVMLELFTDWNARAFDSFWIGFVGLLFLPFSTLAYSVMNALGDPINGYGWVIVAFGFVADLASWFGTRTRQRVITGRRATPWTS